VSMYQLPEKNQLLKELNRLTLKKEKLYGKSILSVFLHSYLTDPSPISQISYLSFTFTFGA
jgi:hypothetical protein